MSEPTLVQRYMKALGDQDWDTLAALHHEDAVFYTPFMWGAKGIPFILAFCRSVHEGFPGVRLVLHDEFYSPEGDKASFRFAMHWHNTGPFLGNEPTGERGMSVETITIGIRDGRITEQFVSVGLMHLPSLELNEWKMDYPREVVDPGPAILTAPAEPGGSGTS
ncbi:nuclear transport factor 2 family protein [Streptomyces sp. NA04227]|uniref:ester cyclase n=1 Tax=Streptomyces sp. NA04227 TaxID=2742136 RepID=UPI00158FAE88|nr:nuclear transport factor 2 family protein [Streptomyces sp. NA04227]QKW06701.1 nuclear transport factor 2 family protein [Streptomyces sp. NA04227]